MQRSNEIDMWVCQSFDELIDRCSDSKMNELLNDIAIKPNGRQEKTVENIFFDSLKCQAPQGVTVAQQSTRAYSDGFRHHDILGEYMSEAIIVVEVKTPFTNHDGIRFHTGNDHTLTKDAHALLIALRDGVISAYELITLFECYPVDASGNVVILQNAIRSNEKAVKETYDIHWPTRKDYDYQKGETEVDSAMGRIADEVGLRAECIKGWERIELTGARRDVRAYLDCALFKVESVTT